MSQDSKYDRHCMVVIDLLHVLCTLRVKKEQTNYNTIARYVYRRKYGYSLVGNKQL